MQSSDSENTTSQRTSSLAARLKEIHGLLTDKLPGLARISVAIYHDGANTLHTLAHSSGEDDPLPHYAVTIDAVPSLKALMLSREARVLNDLEHDLAPVVSRHSSRLVSEGYRSSYTVPIEHHGNFVGFVFFNSRTTGFFNEETLPIMGFAARLVANSVVEDIDATHVLVGAIVALGEITRMRDPETGAHLQRMSRFSNLLATRIADAHALSDEFAESVYRYAPLHDVGKLATPDAVLLKPARLNEAEWDVMRQHPDKGVEIVQLILRNASTPLSNVDILNNIIRYHHEAWNGSGYPLGIAGEAIPLEARIVTVADVFDALTTRRPYKAAWSNAEAIGWMQERAGQLFDPQCVALLAEELPAIESIQRQFADGNL